MKKRDQTEVDRMEPTSLYPLTAEQALKGFMQVDPKAVDDRLRKQGVKKDKKTKKNE